MTTIGRRRGVQRYGQAHGIRFDGTMETILRDYAGRAGVTLADAVRLLLDQAIGGRVSVVETQANRLVRIEAKLDLLVNRTESINEWTLEEDEPDDMAVLAEDVPPEPYWEPPVYWGGSGWER